MMHGREKSDSATVAGKPTNKAVPTAAEPVERRAGAKGSLPHFVPSFRGFQPRGNSKASLDLLTGLSHRPRDGSVVSSLHCMNDPQPRATARFAWQQYRSFAATGQ